MAADETPTRKVTIRSRLRYRLDNLLSRGTGAALLFLAAITAVGVLVASLLLAVFPARFEGSEGDSWIEDSWQSLLRVIDPGTMAGDVGWGTRLLALLVTVFGILIAGTLIGLVATGIEQRVSELRRGRSRVVESGHVVILGASGRLPVVVEQLALANRRRRRNVVVVLARREPDELRDDVRRYADSLYGTRLVFRWGDPTRTSDLAIASIRDARAVIVLADDDGDADAGAVRAVLAAGVALGGFDRVPIVVDIDDPETANSLARACGEGVHPVVAKRSIARIVAFALREPGLSQVVAELMGFRGADIYVREAGHAAGLSFAETVFRYADARPIGRMRPDGTVEINPDPKTRLADTDRLIMIAEDERPPHPAASDGGEPEIVSAKALPREQADPDPERVVIVGWNQLGAQLLEALDERAVAGSSVEVVYDARSFDRDELPDGRGRALELSLTPRRGVTWQRSSTQAAAGATAILLLANRRGVSTEEADSQTLLNLMLLTQDLEKVDGVPPRVVVELLDADNVELAGVTGADDYVVSDAVTSRLMVQHAEQPDRRAVLRSLYDTDGASLHLVAAGDLGITGPARFGDIVAVAYRSGHLALGWRAAKGRGGKVALNPNLDEEIPLTGEDQIVVIG